MPRSVVIYTDPVTLSGLKDFARREYSGYSTKPYTFSFGQKTQSPNLRARICELREGVLGSAIDELVKKGIAVLAAPQDRDVRARTYGELLDEADRATRVATLQFATPIILEVSGEVVPFPVIPTIFRKYIEVWQALSDADISGSADALRHIRVIDFRISCVPTPYGPGAQGWVGLEMEKGRTEEEIALFNGLIDFAFFCGTGLHTDEGLGQTRRMARGYGGGAGRLLRLTSSSSAATRPWPPTHSKLGGGYPAFIYVTFRRATASVPRHPSKLGSAPRTGG